MKEYFIGMKKSLIKILNSISFSSKINICFLFSVFISLIVFFLGNFFSEGSWLDSVLFIDIHDTGMDFFNSLFTVANRKPYTEYGICYPPLSCVFFYMFYKSLPNNIKESYIDGTHINSGNDIRLNQAAMVPYLIMLIMTLLIIGIIVYHTYKGNKYGKIITTISLLFCSGIIYCIDRGNIVIVALLFSLIFVLGYDSKSYFIKEISYICLAIATGLKIYPVILGILLIKNKMWKESLRTVIYGLIFFFFPLIFFEGYDGFKILMENTFFSKFNTDDVARMNLQSIARTIFSMFHIYEPEKMGMWGKIFTISTIIGCFLSIFLKEKWKSISLLCILIITNAGVSVVYMLSFIIIPIIFFLNAEKKKSFITFIYFILFFILIFPCPLPESDYINSLGMGIRFPTINFVQQFALLIFLFILYVEAIYSMIVKIINFKTNKNN